MTQRSDIDSEIKRHPFTTKGPCTMSLLARYCDSCDRYIHVDNNNVRLSVELHRHYYTFACPACGHINERHISPDRVDHLIEQILR